MEAVPRLPMLYFEMKTSEEKANFFPKLKNYIQYHFNEDAESFTNQINQIEGLRASACRPPRDATGCATLKRYYCQLHFLISRFPMGKGGDAAVKFTWKDPYSDITVSASDVTVELAAILYNIGALHSQLGASDNRSSADGMKMACTHFQCAAWAFSHIPEEFPQILSYDASADLFMFMNNLCLAQAQECILEKSMMDNRKATIIAKVAVQTVEYYKQSLKRLTSSNSSDDASIADTIGSKLRKKWEMYLKFKISYHGCIGLLYQGQQSEEMQKMGERVAYYQAAFAKLEEARKLSKGLDNIEAVNEALQFTQDVVEGKRKAGKNENEFIYHEEVPNIATLPEMKGASLVKGIPFSVNDIEISGPDIFGRLIPLKAHETSSIYSEELAKLLRKTTSDVVKAENELETFLSTLQLDELRARDEWELPQEVVDRCAALSAKPDAIQNLLDAMTSLSDTYRDVENMLGDIRAVLQKEEEDVMGYEDVVGKRPPSIAATDLTREAKKYQDAHAKASESNQTLHKAMQLHIANLRLLSLPIRELEEQMPAVSFGSTEDESAITQMETLMKKVNEMKQQREMLMAELREAINRDDITQKVVTFTGESKADLFREEMSKHQRQVNLINQNIAAQEKILAAVQDAYAKYSMARRGVTSQLHRRDAMVASLIASYDAYEDLIAKSNKGLEFYSKLQSNVSKLLQRVKSTCKVQEEEREQILSSILEDVPRGARRPGVAARNERNAAGPYPPADSAPRNTTPPYRPQPEIPSRIYNDLGSSSSGGLKLKDYLNMKKETGKMSLVSGSGNTVPFAGSGYAPAASPQLYDAPTAWVPGVRPAPVGSEESDPVVPRHLDSDARYSSPHQWNAETNKQNPYYYQQYSEMPGNSSSNYPYNYPARSNYGVPQPSASFSGAPPAYDGYAGSQAGYQQPAPPSGPGGYGPTTYQELASLPPMQPYPQSSYQDPASLSPAQTYPQSSYQDPTPLPPTQTYPQSSYQDTTGVVPPSYSPSNFASPILQTSGAQPYISGGNYVSAMAQPVQQYNTDIVANQYPAGVPQQSETGAGTALPQPSSDPAGVSQNYYVSTPTVPQNTYTPSYTICSTDPASYITTAVPQAYSNPYDYTYPAHGGVGGPTSSPDVGALGYPQPSYYPASTSLPYVSDGSYATTAMPIDSYATNQGTYYPEYPMTTPLQEANTVYPGEHQFSQTADVVRSDSTVAYQQPTDWNYIPQQGGGYNQDSEYLQSGNSSLYTQTQQTHPFTPTSSEVYLATPKTLDLKQEPCSSPSQTDARFIPYPGGNAATQSPVTYRQAGFGSVAASTVTTSSADNSMSSATVLPSNVDLLAGLEFEVSQSPLVPQTPTKGSPVKATPVIQPKPAVVEDKPKEVVPPVEFEEKKMDADTLNAFVPEVEKLEKFVEGLTLKTLNGPTTLDLKWKEIMESQEKDSHCRSISVARCYPMKNRFPDILPYDDSRIELPSTKDDYINASFLKPLTSGMLPLILTQAPLPVTYGDFWTMVMEQQVEVVVCLLGDLELGGHVYWPEDKSNDLTLGRLRLSLQTCNVRPHWVERILSVTSMDSKASRVVVHLQFTAWPGSSFPASPAPFLGFVQEVKTFLQQQRSRSHPAVVHCLSGVGRTGMFSAVLAATLDVEAGRGVPDMVAIASRMSQARKNSLRDREHLKFAYQSVLYFSQDLLLKRGILTNRASFEEKKVKEGKCHTRHPSEDFLVPSDVDQLQAKFESLEAGEKAKDGEEKEGARSSRPGSNKASSGRASPSQALLAAMDPNAFNLSAKDSKPGRSKQKFTPESFSKATASLVKPSADSAEDPLSSLDPLWSLKK